MVAAIDGLEARAGYSCGDFAAEFERDDRIAATMDHQGRRPHLR